MLTVVVKLVECKELPQTVGDLDEVIAAPGGSLQENDDDGATNNLQMNALHGC
jgi:hypothetical protein